MTGPRRPRSTSTRVPVPVHAYIYTRTHSSTGRICVVVVFHGIEKVTEVTGVLVPRVYVHVPYTRTGIMLNQYEYEYSTRTGVF